MEQRALTDGTNKNKGKGWMATKWVSLRHCKGEGKRQKKKPDNETRKKGMTVGLEKKQAAPGPGRICHSLPSKGKGEKKGEKHKRPAKRRGGGTTIVAFRGAGGKLKKNAHYERAIPIETGKKKKSKKGKKGKGGNLGDTPKNSARLSGSPRQWSKTNGLKKRCGEKRPRQGW